MQLTRQANSTTHDIAGADVSSPGEVATGPYADPCASSRCMNRVSSVSSRFGAIQFSPDASRHASLFLHVIFGSVATSALVVGGVEPVLASSGATIFYLLAAFVLRFRGQQPAAVFCGTFAGMTSFFAFFNRAPFSPGFSMLINLCIAILTGLLYVLIMYFEHKLPKGLFSGYGGRLGAIAFIGSATCLIVTGLLIRLSSDDFQLLVLKDSAAFSEAAPVAMILVSAVGSFLTRILTKDINSTIPGLNVVMSASVCGFAGGMIFLSILPLGPIASLYWYAGNFAGMSSTLILDSHAKILLAGAMTGVFLAGLHYYGSGVGGLLGFSAFLAVIVLKSICRSCLDSELVEKPARPALLNEDPAGVAARFFQSKECCPSRDESKSCLTCE